MKTKSHTRMYEYFYFISIMHHPRYIVGPPNYLLHVRNPND